MFDIRRKVQAYQQPITVSGEATRQTPRRQNVGLKKEAIFICRKTMTETRHHMPSCI